MLQKIINFTIYLVVFCLPLYLVSFKIGWVPFNILEVLIYVLFVLWVINLKVGPEKCNLATQGHYCFRSDLFFSDLFWPVLLIFFGVTISTWFSNDLEVSAGIWKGWFLAPLLFLVVINSHIRTKEQINRILISLTFSGVGVALIALFYWFANNLAYDGRLQGFYLSANYLAMYLSPILVLSLYLYSFIKNKIVKILLIISYLLLMIVIYLTCSYGAWLGLGIALIFIVLNRKDKKLALILLFLIILGLVLQIPSQKFQGFLDLSYPSLKSRLVIWQSAWEISKDHFLIGIGPGMFQKYYLSYQDRFVLYSEWAVPQPHNIFLAFWLQTGLLGLIGFIWLLIVFFRNALRSDLRKGRTSIISVILIASMIYILIHGLVDTTYWKNDLALIFWLIIILGCKVSRPSD